MKCTSSKKVCLTAVTLWLFIISLCCRPIDGANILGLFTSHSPSGFMVHMSVVKALAEQGHNVTVVSSLEPKVTHKSIRHIVIPPTEQQEYARNAIMANNAAKNSSLLAGIIKGFNAMNLMLDTQFHVLQDKRFTQLYQMPDTKFDVLILGYFFNDYQLGVAAKFQCPIILDWTAPPMEILHAYMGNPRELSYVPNMNIGVGVGGAMNFRQRIHNLITGIGLKVIKLIVDYGMEKYYRQLFPDNNFPTYQQMQRNVSLLFVNHHFSEGPIRPNVPAAIEIGGIQINDKPDALPKDISEFLNSSTENGAILFTLGSNLQTSNINPVTISIIFNTLSSLEQNVIWKWEDLPRTPGKSKNILFKKWLPQSDILAHPNLKIFITHAGKGGLIEAQYHGVPMVALPFYGDQHGNAEKVVAFGHGISLKSHALTETAFKNAITEVLTNPAYAENVKKFSQLYRDRPLTAKQSVVYWTEYVIRHHGAAHMQSSLVHMNVLQSSNLDVIAFLCLVVYIIWRLLKFGFKFLWQKVNNKRRNNKKGSKKIKQK